MIDTDVYTGETYANLSAITADSCGSVTLVFYRNHYEKNGTFTLNISGRDVFSFKGYGPEDLAALAKGLLEVAEWEPHGIGAQE